MSNSRIEAAIHALDGKRLERLMSDLLEREGYEVDPTGTSGPDGGREAIFTDGDRTGILHCSVQKDDWVDKAHDDARKAVENFDQEFDLFTFVTTQDPAGVMRDRVEEELASEWNMQTKVWDYERIRNELVGDSENHDLIREHLSVDPNRPFVDVEAEVDNLYEDLIERIVPVRDNLVRALEQEEGADLRPGVESTLEEFDRVLEEENVEAIEPDPGSDVDPVRHQVMLRVGSDEPAGTIAEVYQPGYEIGDSVIREAQVTVSDGSGDEE